MSKNRPEGIEGRNVQTKLVTKLYKKFVKCVHLRNDAYFLLANENTCWYT